MKKSTPIVLLAAVCVYFATAAFQCGSQELTTAKLAMQQRQWEKAEQSLEREVAKNPQSEEGWYLLGQTRLELKKYKEMNDAYVQALAAGNSYKKEIDNNRLAVWAQLFNEGVQDYNQGRTDPAKYDVAIEKFLIATELQPDSGSTYYVLALAYYAKNDYARTIENLNKSLQRNPKNDDAARWLGQVHMMLGSNKRQAKDEAGAMEEFNKAVGAYEQAYNANRMSPENIMALIEAYEATNQQEKAVALTRDAITAGDDEMSRRLYRYAYGVFLLRQDKYAESVEEFKKVLANEPPDPESDQIHLDATYNLGVAYLNWGVAMKTESDKKAEADRQAARGRDVKVDESYKEKFKAALPYLEKSGELRPDDVNLWQQLGRLYAHLNMPQKSKFAFDRVDQIIKYN
jgi:tetratricopeptide (TPR) repeat protein